MAVHIIQIEKHKFVCGLFWQSLTRPRELAKEAQELSKKVDSNLLVIRQDQAVAQAGYAHTRDGVQSGYYSLAAILSKTISLEGAEYDGRHQPVHSWLGAFKLPDGMWFYCAVRDANFLPNGDFAGTKEQVLDRLLSDYSLGSWNVVIGDPELEENGFHNFSAKTLLDLIPRNTAGRIRTYSWWALRPAETHLPWKLIAVSAAVALIAAAVGMTYWNRYQKKKAEDERERAINSASQKNITGKTVESGIPHPWRNKPLPRDLARACMKKFIIISPGGWRLDEFQCTQTVVRYSWSRGDSSVSNLLRDVPDATLSLDGEKATYSVALSVNAERDEKLPDENTLMRYLLSRFQALGIGLGMKPIQKNSGDAGNQSAEWKTYSISANLGPLTPLAVGEILTQPGIRLDKLVYRGETWSIEGVIYAE